MPVKGLAGAFTKQTGTMTAPAVRRVGVSALPGGHGQRHGDRDDERHGQDDRHRERTPRHSDRRSAPCRASAALASTGNRDTDRIYYGESLEVIGHVDPGGAGRTVPVAGASLPVKLGYAVSGTTKVGVLGTAKTLADGSYSLAVKPTVSGERDRVAGGVTGYNATMVRAGHCGGLHADLGPDRAGRRLRSGLRRPSGRHGRLTRTVRRADDRNGRRPACHGATVAVKVTAPGKTAVTVGSGQDPGRRDLQGSACRCGSAER